MFNVEKLALLRSVKRFEKRYQLKLCSALAGLQGYGDEIRCTQCQEDGTVTDEQREAKYKRGHNITLRHHITFHEAFPFAERWLKQQMVTGRCVCALRVSLMSAGKFLCPFDTILGDASDQSDEDPVPCGYVRSIKTRPATMREHLVTNHREQLAAISPKLVYALSNETRGQAEARIRERLEAEMPGTDWNRTTRTFKNTYAGLAIPGVQGMLDYELLRPTGMGLSAFDEGHTDFKQDKIPVDWLDENGHLRF